MDDAIEYKYYSAHDIESWLLHGVDNGLSEKIISKPRALALINHPDVNADSTLLSVIFVNGEVAAYNAVFPEKLQKPDLTDYVFGTTLYAYPKFLGRGLGYATMMHIKEAYDYKYFGLESSKESVFIDERLGSKVIYYDRYKFTLKRTVSIRNFRTLLSCMYEQVRLYRQNINIKRLKKKSQMTQYQLEYVNYIDDATYQFIVEHSSKDFFLRSQSVLNWILKYNLLISAPLLNKVQMRPFGAYYKFFHIYAVKVLNENNLVGFYMLREREGEFLLLYLYAEEQFKENVNISIIEHLLELEATSFRTFNDTLTQQLKQYAIALRVDVEKVSFTMPKDFVIDTTLCVQGGDGDMIT